MTDLQIRRIGPADAAAFRDIRLEALRDEPQNYATSHAEWCDRPLADFEQLLRNVQYVAADDAGALGAICGWYAQGLAVTRHRGTLVAVYVRPALRRRGLFRRMIETIVQDAKPRIRQLELHVHANNTVARAAYIAAGFVEVGRIPDALNHDGHFSDELLMHRRITA